jgi:hypothetical protein
MKRISLIVTVVAAVTVVFLQGGCAEHAKNERQISGAPTKPVEPAVVVQKEAAQNVGQAKPDAQKTVTEPKVNIPQPQIRFDKLVHDFGDVGPGTYNSCEFGFTNVGKGLLKITRTEAPCGCTVPELKKKTYLAGESGILKVTYHASPLPGTARKYVYVHSNDKASPKVTLTLTAKITTKVSYEPKRLNLLIRDGKAECPSITLTSIDGKPFSIKGFKSTTNCITADIDPSVEATRFVLEPKLDAEKLQKVTNGVIELTLTHPQCKEVSIPFSALSRFKLNPPVLIVWDAEAGKAVKRDVFVLNNYNEEFEIESVSSSNKYVKVLAQEKIRNGYKIGLEITPPASEGQMRFTDVVFVQVKDGQQLGITCRGFFARKRAEAP